MSIIFYFASWFFRILLRVWLCTCIYSTKLYPYNSSTFRSILIRRRYAFSINTFNRHLPVATLKCVPRISLLRWIVERWCSAPMVELMWIGSCRPIRESIQSISGLRECENCVCTIENAEMSESEFGRLAVWPRRRYWSQYLYGWLFHYIQSISMSMRSYKDNDARNWTKSDRFGTNSM